MNTNNLFIFMSKGNEGDQAFLLPPAFLFFSHRPVVLAPQSSKPGKPREWVLSQPSAALSVFRIPGLTS